jgi:hypothetical protein
MKRSSVYHDLYQGTWLPMPDQNLIYLRFLRD